MDPNKHLITHFLKTKSGLNIGLSARQQQRAHKINFSFLYKQTPVLIQKAPIRKKNL